MMPTSSPFNNFAIKGNLWTTLTSLFPSSKPKNMCHIHKDWLTITSRIMFLVLSLSWNWPYHAIKQFFQDQCIQSIALNMLGNPLSSLIFIYFLTFAKVGCLKLLDSKHARIISTSLFKHLSVVDSLNLQYLWV
jgi:hypothetical protein